MLFLPEISSTSLNFILFAGKASTESFPFTRFFGGGLGVIFSSACLKFKIVDTLSDCKLRR